MFILKVSNPHDKFFKENFSKVEVAKSFVENYLPSEVLKIIDINTLKPQKDSFINKDLEEVFSDMLFQVNMNGEIGYLYFLFEHKSYVSPNVAFQLLRYMIEIWDAKIKNENQEKLPMIIPLVIYHGKEKWKVKTSLGQMVNGYNDLPNKVRKYIPNYEYLIYDLSHYTDDEIKGVIRLKIVLRILKDIYTAPKEKIFENIHRALIALNKIENQQEGIECFETYIRYIINASKTLAKEDIEKVIEEVSENYSEGSEVIMTIAKIWEEQGIEKGRKEGLKQGMQRGMQEGKLEVARNLIKINLSTEQITEVTGLELQRIEKLREQIERQENQETN
jgi:predicted transposase/invertase (TIGR01784 family)